MLTLNEINHQITNILENEYISGTHSGLELTRKLIHLNIINNFTKAIDTLPRSFDQCTVSQFTCLSLPFPTPPPLIPRSTDPRSSRY
jgi:hypothetical protein